MKCARQQCLDFLAHRSLRLTGLRRAPLSLGSLVQADSRFRSKGAGCCHDSKEIL